MPTLNIAGLLVVLVAAGCAGMGCSLPRESPPAEAQQSRTVAVKPSERPEPKVESPAVEPPRVAATRNEAEPAQASQVMTQPKPAAVEPPPVGAAPDTIVVPKPEAKREKPTVAATPAGPSAAPKAAPGAKAAAAPAPKEPVPKKESAAAAKPAAAPSLDLDTLEKRLKETNAIGVLTKLTLKNQVDDLLERFKALHQGRSKATLAELRQPFDLLILKVLTLLQDGDPSLASAIRASREAIWGILTDPAKFARL